MATIQYLFPMAGGFDISSVDNDVCIYTKPVGGISNIFVRLISNPLSDTCLTIPAPDPGIGLTQRKGVPSFHPDGTHFVCQVEVASHPYPGMVGSVGDGWYHDMWISDINGLFWKNLTSHAAPVFGTLHPHISNGGGEVTWGHVYGQDPYGQYMYHVMQKVVPGTAPFGLYTLVIADLTIAGPASALTNLVWGVPGGGTFYEPSGWSPDDKYVLVGSDAFLTHVHQIDVCRLRLNDWNLSSLITLPASFDEFLSASPDGRRVCFMSNMHQTDWYSLSDDSIPFRQTIETDLYVIDTYCRNVTRLTYFNTPGHPESIGGLGKAIVSAMKWVDTDLIYFGMTWWGVDGNFAGSGLFRITDFE